MREKVPTGASRRRAACLLAPLAPLAFLALAFSGERGAGAASTIDPTVSAVCARAEADLAQPGVGPPWFGGGLSVEAWAHAKELITSAPCNCAVAETVPADRVDFEGADP